VFSLLFNIDLDANDRELLWFDETRRNMAKHGEKWRNMAKHGETWRNMAKSLDFLKNIDLFNINEDRILSKNHLKYF
jgi:hypothetical protein